MKIKDKGGGKRGESGVGGEGKRGEECREEEWVQKRRQGKVADFKNSS